VTFRAGILGNDTGHNDHILDWSYNDTIARYQDGTSNQWLIAERHVPAWAVHNDNAGANAWLGGYGRSVNGTDCLAVARPVSVNSWLFARSPHDVLTPESTTAPSNASVPSLGSSHTGIVNVLYGDGAVRAVSTSTNPEMAWQLTAVNDGAPVSLP